MNHHQSGLFVSLFLVLLSHVEAQSQSPPIQDSLASQDAVTNFQPSLAVVIGILAIMFSLTFVLLVYAKFCHRANSVHNNQQSTLDGLLRSGSRFSGIDKTVIESLPFFRFSSLRGSREGLECAVCLSKFEDIEILRLLPKCKHAFHIDCVDRWLEKHSSCPLCRHRVSPDDLSLLTYSNSLRFLWSSTTSGRSDSGMRSQDSNLELFVEREVEDGHGSSRFSVGSSFRRIDKGKNKEEELPIQECSDLGDGDEDQRMLHKLNHRIVVSDFFLKNRWSSVTSSDLMFLSSEMISSVSSDRFSALGAHKIESPKVEDGGIMKIKEEIERKREFEDRVSKMSPNHPLQCQNGPTKASNKGELSPSHHRPSRVLINVDDKRSMSEITVHPRFKEFGLNDSTSDSASSRNELWLPIARRTVQWFANRKKSQQSQKTTQSLNV